MALTGFVQKLINQISSDSRAEWRTAGGKYVDTQRQLAFGAELDSKQVVEVLKTAGISEQQFEKDAETMAKRVEWSAQRQRHQQSHVDHKNAEAELLNAQQAMQEAIARLTPAIQAAEAKMKAAEYVMLTTASAESNLMADENIIDRELLTREAEILKAMKPINEELAPLLRDRGHKEDSLRNAEFQLQRLEAREQKTFMGSLAQWFDTPASLRSETARIADLKAQLQQLDDAIRPRLAEQQRLQNELNQIIQEKLKP